LGSLKEGELDLAYGKTF